MYKPYDVELRLVYLRAPYQLTCLITYTLPAFAEHLALSKVLALARL